MHLNVLFSIFFSLFLGSSTLAIIQNTCDILHNGPPYVCMVHLNIYSLLMFRHKWQFDNICIDLYDIKQKQNLMNAAKNILCRKEEHGYYSLFLSIRVSTTTIESIREHSPCSLCEKKQVFFICHQFDIQKILLAARKKKEQFIHKRWKGHITIADTVKAKDDIDGVFTLAV